MQKIRFIKFTAAIFFQLFLFSCVNANENLNPQSETETVNYNGFFSAGAYGGEEAFGLGLSFGVNRQQMNTMYSLRYTLFLDVFNSIDECENKNHVIVCSDSEDEEDRSSIREFALLYGKKWNSFWFSGGIGHIKGENVAGLFKDDTINFSTYGFAYSIFWQGSSRWFMFYDSVEISGNINSDDSYMFIALRASI